MRPVAYFYLPMLKGNDLVSICMDHNAEELASHTLFNGKSRSNNMVRLFNISYGDICKSDCWNQTLWPVTISQFVFQSKKLQTKHILDQANLCIQKTRFDCWQSVENVENLRRLNDDCKSFKDLRGSSPYWKQIKKKETFAIIRELGIRTWFTSVSSAEIKLE